MSPRISSSSGWRVSSEKLEPKPSASAPLKGLERILGRRAAAEAVRTIAKFLIVGGVTVLTIRSDIGDIMGLQQRDAERVHPALALLIGQSPGAWRC